MNKQFFIAWPVTFVAWMAGSFVIHGATLSGDYAQLTNLFRTPEDSGKYFPLMLLAHAIIAGALVWIYQRGVTDRPWLGQGLRFGVAVSLLTCVPTYTIYYVVQPMPPALVAKQIALETILILALGVLVALLCRRKAPA